MKLLGIILIELEDKMDKTSFIIIVCLLVIIFDTIFLSFIFKGLSIFNEDYEKLKAGCGEPLN